MTEKEHNDKYITIYLTILFIAFVFLTPTFMRERETEREMD